MSTTRPCAVLVQPIGNLLEETMGINIHGIDAPVLADFAADQHPDAKPKITPRAADAADNAWPSGNDNAASGATGSPGDQGFTGQDGLNGGHTPPQIRIHITTFINGFFDVTVRGGNGARGQKGGVGGQGGGSAGRRKRGRRPVRRLRRPRWRGWQGGKGREWRQWRQRQ